MDAADAYLRCPSGPRVHSFALELQPVVQVRICPAQITPPSCVGSAGATPLSQAGFKRTVAGKGQQLTLLAVEVHADGR